jgi:glycosyltransferase involved in cell wall biosynthesis
VPELVGDGVNGRLVEPEDPAALAEVIAELIRAPALRVRLGGAARRRVLAGFGADAGLDHLAERLRAEPGPASPAAV